MTFGTLYGVGVGPGDPELITLKALRIIKSVPVICHPRCEASAHSISYAIVKDYIDRAKQIVLELPFPISLEEAHNMWEEASDTVIRYLSSGSDVAFITEGDPLLYSTFSYLLDSITKKCPGITIDVVPGVSVVNALSAILKKPLVTTKEKLAILPAKYCMQNLAQVLEEFETVVLLKVNEVLEQVATLLQREDLLSHSILVEKLGMPDQRVLEGSVIMEERRPPYFSALIVKKK